MTLNEMKTRKEFEAMTNSQMIAYLAKLEKENPKVDFALLYELHQEAPNLEFADLISYLDMNNIPMTETVKKLGVCHGILYAWH